MKKVIILGTGGTALDILDVLRDLNVQAKNPLYSCIGFLDDDKSKWDKEYFGVKVLTSLAKASDFDDAYFINGIGNADNFWKKEGIIAKTKISTDRFLTIIHPTASVSTTAILGKGTVVFQQATIAVNASIGNHVVILPGSIVSHDVSIGDYSCITGGVSISGRVRIEKSCFLGTNSSIIGDTVIGDYAMVGMGSVVLRDVVPKTVVAGNPAGLIRKIKTKEID